jgi:hypothetical protein
MSARANAPQVAYLPSVADEKFLKSVVEILDRLRAESDLRGHNLLGSLLAITKGEAEDDLKTCAKTHYIQSRHQDHDDGAAVMAQKFACRGGRPAQINS